MFSAWMSELYKFKRSKMNALIVIGALLPVFLNTAVAFHELGSTPRIRWGDFFNSNLLIMSLLMAPSLFALFTGYVFAREYQERMINSLYTALPSRLQILAAKLLTLAILMAVTLGLAYGLTILGGWLLPHEPLSAATAWKFAKAYGLLLLLEIALLPVCAVASLIGKTYIPSMALGVFAVVSSLTIISSQYGTMYPWSAPVVMVMGYVDPVKTVHWAQGWLTLGLAFVVPLLAAIRIIYRSDIHNG